ncbi:MAG: hypothetical protein MUE44_21190 [Oscillatoriaceae cyanobacterium Prado104]|jgi:hypothetical protein|nr:hypothetical protein [Oscillatoriaceae cyanobacterium Prado104]
MNDSLPPIYFYIPKNQWPVGDLPQIPEEYGQWMSDWNSRYGRGKYDWTLQTYLHLKSDGLLCKLIDFIPECGIFISHRDFLPPNLQPLPKLLVVCIKADREPHPWAQLHVVQNHRDELLQRESALWQSYPLRFWVQPKLIQRDRARGSRFENAAFFGVAGTLAPELLSLEWKEKLAVLGLRWEAVGCDRWQDYSDVDVAVAVRCFGGNNTFDSKPASKLINAWHAGIPAILGRESAYQNERKSELDYIEVTSVDRAIGALFRLKYDLALRLAMVENGKIRAREINNAGTILQWRNFLTGTAYPAYYKWCETSQQQQQLFFKRRYLSLKFHQVRSSFLR